MWELLTGEEPYADLHYGTIIGNSFVMLKSGSLDLFIFVVSFV